MAQAKPNCPICGWPAIPVVYGEKPTFSVDSQTEVFGGFNADDLSPDLCCTNCDWSGQEWHVAAPLTHSIWILIDRERLSSPIGLVAGRYDEVIETFFLGQWTDLRSTEQYEHWLELVHKPLTLTAPFGDVSPALVAELRAGLDLLDEGSMFAAGFQALLQPPRFKLDNPMNLPD